MTPQDQAPAAPEQQAPGSIDVEPMIAKAREGIPANMQDVFDKAVLSGMRVMFDASSHEMTLAELDGPEPLEVKLSNGTIKLVYMLWEQSNKTLPPQLLVPLTLVLTLRAFEFLQMSKDPEATKEVMGEAVALAVQGVMDRAGATADKIPELMKQQGGSTPPAQGMIAAASERP